MLSFKELLAKMDRSPSTVKNIPTADDLEGRILTTADELLDHNPRVPGTHGWLAFEVLRLAGGKLTFEEYAHRLFHPAAEIAELAKDIPGQPNAFQHLKHIRCDIYRRTVKVQPPLPPEWFNKMKTRSSNGSRPYCERGA